MKLSQSYHNVIAKVPLIDCKVTTVVSHSGGGGGGHFVYLWTVKFARFDRSEMKYV